MADSSKNGMKIFAIIACIIAVAGIATSLIFIMKNSKHKRMLTEANAALKALGAPEVKVAKPTDSAAQSAGTTSGTNTNGSSSGVNAAIA